MSDKPFETSNAPDLNQANKWFKVKSKITGRTVTVPEGHKALSSPDFTKQGKAITKEPSKEPSKE